MALFAQREVVASASRTASGNSGYLALRPGTQAVSVAVDVTAVTGTTPTLDIEVEWSTDGGATFFKADPADSFTQIIAAKKVTERYTAKGLGYRVVWTIAGALADFTFALDEYAEGDES